MNEQQPTAELDRSQHQTDEGDLMPYVLLDAIERAADRDKRSPLEVWELMRAEFPPTNSSGDLDSPVSGCSAGTSGSASATRRLHLDDESLDPKTWCRFRNLQWRLRAQLAQLAARAGEGP